MSREDSLRAALLRAHARWSTGAEARFPPADKWEPLAGTVGTEKAALTQSFKAMVPTVPTVPTEKENMASATLQLTPDEEERAAILEFDGGLDRTTAERKAKDWPSDWSGS